jgi:hypothetical protein
MATVSLTAICESVAHTLGRPYDFFIKEKIRFSAINLRAMFLRRDYEKNGLSPILIQRLGCLPLQCVDAAECCSVVSTVKFYRTQMQIPAPLRTKDLDTFKYVGLIDNQHPFQESYFEDLPYIVYNKYTSKIPRYTYFNGYIYCFYLPEDTEYITVNSIFSDPEKAAYFNICSGQGCPTDDDFYFPEDLMPMLEAELIKMYIGEKEQKDQEIRINSD